MMLNLTTGPPESLPGSIYQPYHRGAEPQQSAVLPSCRGRGWVTETDEIYKTVQEKRELRGD